jgi:hypothetical protein
MSAELIGILSVGIGLGGLMLAMAGWLRGDLREMRGDLREMRGDLAGLAERVTALERGQARIEGLLEGAGLSGGFRQPHAAEAAGD